MSLACGTKIFRNLNDQPSVVGQMFKPDETSGVGVESGQLGVVKGIHSCGVQVPGIHFYYIPIADLPVRLDPSS